MSNLAQRLGTRRRPLRARTILWALGGLALALLAALFPSQAAQSLRFVALSLVEMLPVVLLAMGLAAYVRASGADGLIARVFAGRVNRMIVVAALFGAFTPLCGIGVLPIIAGLLRAGVPLAPIMAFWLASPITDPAMLAITAGTLGLSFAVAKTLAAFLIGLAGGYGTLGLQARGAFSSPLRESIDRVGAGDGCTGSCDTGRVFWRFWRDAPRRRIFLDEAKDSGFLMLKWLSLAFLLESLINEYFPPEIIARFVGAENAWGIPLAGAIGTPIYVDGYAALPLVRGLIDLGMTPGAALAFLIAGGITSAYASVAVYALVRLPVFLWYLAIAIVSSITAGYAFQLLAG
jgi:uncharacterized membrane protein YraQ (UPF0718 family)